MHLSGPRLETTGIFKRGHNTALLLQEILGGILDIEPTLWRKPHKEEFEQQRQKILKFAAWWKPYDWTQKLSGGKESDSD